MPERKTMRVRYLGDDKPEAGSYGSESFKIHDGVATVPVDVGANMVAAQPLLWADASEPEADVKKRVKAAEELEKEQEEQVRRAFEAADVPVHTGFETPPPREAKKGE